MKINTAKNKQRVGYFVSILAMLLIPNIDKYIFFIPDNTYLKITIMVLLVIVIFVLVEIRVLNLELTNMNITNLSFSNVVKELLRLIFSINPVYPDEDDYSYVEKEVIPETIENIGDDMDDE